MQRHIKITIRGNVQGVGFRFSAMQAAYRFGVKGFAQNLGRDRVYIEAEGDPEKIEVFQGWCNYGPLGAKIEQVAVEEGVCRGFEEFNVY